MTLIDTKRFEKDCGKAVGFKQNFIYSKLSHGMQEVVGSIPIGSTNFSQSFPYTYERDTSQTRPFIKSVLNHFGSLKVSKTVGILCDLPKSLKHQNKMAGVKLSGPFGVYPRALPTVEAVYIASMRGDEDSKTWSGRGHVTWGFESKSPRELFIRPMDGPFPTKQGVVVARFTNGWIKLHRSVMSKDLMDHPILLALWVRLLTSATYMESKIIWNGKQRVLPPGSVVFGYREFAESWNCSANTIKKWVKYLEKTERIVLEVCTLGCVVTICNWSSYQSNDEEPCTERAHELHTDCTPTAHGLHINEEVKNKRIKEYIYAGFFEKFWGVYPRKLGPGKALTTFKTKIKSQKDAEDIVLASLNYSQYCQVNKKDPEFVLLPTTFLNKDTWRDWVNPEVPLDMSENDSQRFGFLREVKNGAS